MHLFAGPRTYGDLTPIEGITVVAERAGQKFEAVTDAKGRYEFRDLLDGEYKVQPLLAPARHPAEISDMRHAKPGDTAHIHRSILCGVRLDFIAQHAGVYPGVIYETDTQMIDLTVGQEMTGLVFKIPPH